MMKDIVERDEDSHWFAHLAALEEMAMPAAQRSSILGVWLELSGLIQQLRRPAMGKTSDKLYYLSWAYSDLVGSVATIEIDENGSLEWFVHHGTSTFSGEGDMSECIASIAQAMKVFVYN